MDILFSAISQKKKTNKPDLPAINSFGGLSLYFMQCGEEVEFLDFSKINNMIRDVPELLQLIKPGATYVCQVGIQKVLFSFW